MRFYAPVISINVYDVVVQSHALHMYFAERQTPGIYYKYRRGRVFEMSKNKNPMKITQCTVSYAFMYSCISVNDHSCKLIKITSQVP